MAKVQELNLKGKIKIVIKVDCRRRVGVDAQDSRRERAARLWA